MGENRGKQFEEEIRKSLERVPDTSVDRLHDQMSGFKGSSNICDFVAYHCPDLFYLECKSCYGNTLPFSNITDTQWDGLLEKSTYCGVTAGYMIWFIDHDLTVFISARAMKQLKDSGDKSVNYNTFAKKLNGNFYIIPAKKRKILFDYDLKEFIGG